MIKDKIYASARSFDSRLLKVFDSLQFEVSSITSWCSMLSNMTEV